MGQAGMPEAIRIAVEGFGARPQHKAHACAPIARRRRGFRAGIVAVSALASRAAIDRAYALLLSEPQILVAWPATDDEPEIIGDPALITTTSADVLDFASWLEADTACDMDHSVDALRARGLSFAMTV